MFGVRIERAVSSFSVAVLLAAVALAVDYRALDKRLREARSTNAQLELLLPLAQDPQVDEEMRTAVLVASGADLDSRQARVKSAVSKVRARAFLEGQEASRIAGSDVKSRAEKIKSNPLYRDTGVKEGSNWLARAFEKLGGLFGEPDLRLNRPDVRPMSFDPGFLVKAVWVLLGLILAGFLYFALRHFAWKRSLTRKAKALLEDDEPERTLDEWLDMAGKLETEGKYREAVRCLFLACLLKFDEKGIARFDRGETNWEHLARIEASPSMPPGLDFRAPTGAFDRVWYGFKVRGKADLDDFRHWYSRITEALQEKAA